jgi:hypothetical protein
VLYGPQGSGKGLHGQAIAEHMGLQHVVELHDVQFVGDPLRRHGHLYLADCDFYAQRAATRLGTPVIQIEKALKAIGVCTAAAKSRKEVTHV